MQHGYGVETWADGSVYEGNYKEGKKHGQGSYTWQDGSKYVGEWEENKINGEVCEEFNKIRVSIPG
jgi:hypothetical protein